MACHAQCLAQVWIIHGLEHNTQTAKASVESKLLYFTAAEEATVAAAVAGVCTPSEMALT